MYPLDVDQLRSAFTLTGAIHERVKAVRDNLIERIKAPPATLLEGPLTILHMVPFESLDPARVLDLSDLKAKAGLFLMPLGQRVPGDLRFNFDGLLSTVRYPGAGHVVGYTQLFRSGIIESVDSSLATRLRSVQVGTGIGGMIPGVEIEAEWLMAFRRFLKLQEQLKIALPIMAFLSVIGVGEYALVRNFQYAPLAKRFERSELLLPGVIVDRFDVDRGALFRPVFDILWNSAGFDKCPDYTQAGSFDDAGQFQHEIQG